MAVDGLLMKLMQGERITLFLTRNFHPRLFIRHSLNNQRVVLHLKRVTYESTWRVASSFSLAILSPPKVKYIMIHLCKRRKSKGWKGEEREKKINEFTSTELEAKVAARDTKNWHGHCKGRVKRGKRFFGQNFNSFFHLFISSPFLCRELFLSFALQPQSLQLLHPRQHEAHGTTDTRINESIKCVNDYIYTNPQMHLKVTKVTFFFKW